MPDQVAIIGGGAFGSAMATLLDTNRTSYQVFDQGDEVLQSFAVAILAVPTQLLRGALGEKSNAFREDTIIVSCAKGIERTSGLLPFQIYAEVVGRGRYHTLSGPSFASEIVAKVPTVVDIAGLLGTADVGHIESLLETPYFKIEAHDHVHEIELAGALKNVYAIAAGFLSGAGGGNNTHAHLQVVALREYQTLAQALGRSYEVVRPSIVGDLSLTCGSQASRNFRFGSARAEGGERGSDTVEGAETVAPLLLLAKKNKVTLRLAEAVKAIVQNETDARRLLYTALGF